MADDEKADDEKAAALERKRRRLEAWKKRQEDKAKAAESAEPKAKITLSLGVKKAPKKKKKPKKRPLGFGGFDNVRESDNGGGSGNDEKKSLDLLDVDIDIKGSSNAQSGSSPAKKKRRWDAPTAADSASSSIKPESTTNIGNEDKSNKNYNDSSKGSKDSQQQIDDLDKFMNTLNSGAMGKVVQNDLSIDVSGSMMRPIKSLHQNHSNHNTPLSGGVITPEELAKLTGVGDSSKGKSKSSNSKPEGALYGPSDWETSASEVSRTNFNIGFYSNFGVHKLNLTPSCIPTLGRNR